MNLQLLNDLIANPFPGTVTFRLIKFFEQTFDLSMVLSDHLNRIGHDFILLGIFVSNWCAALRRLTTHTRTITCGGIGGMVFD
jgi:hypothetical protein